MWCRMQSKVGAIVQLCNCAKSRQVRRCPVHRGLVLLPLGVIRTDLSTGCSPSLRGHNYMPPFHCQQDDQGSVGLSSKGQKALRKAQQTPVECFCQRNCPNTTGIIQLSFDQITNSGQTVVKLLPSCQLSPTCNQQCFPQHKHQHQQQY